MKRLTKYLGVLLAGLVLLVYSSSASAEVAVTLTSINPNYIIAPHDAPQEVKNQSDIIADGVNDQNAIQTAIGTGYRTVRLQPGYYHVSSNFTLAPHLRLIGYGANITLNNNSNTAILIVSAGAEDTWIEGITFDGNKSNQSNNCSIVETNYSPFPIRVHFVNDTFSNAKYMSINSQKMFDSTIEGCYFYNAGYAHFRDHSGEGNKSINNVYDTWGYVAIGIDGRNGLYTGDTFKNMGTAPAFRIVPDGTYPQKGNKILGETFIGNNSGEIGVYGESAYSLNLLVALNSFDNVTYPTAGNMTTTTNVSNIINN